MRIRVLHFGPIEGYVDFNEQQGWVDIKPLCVLIGPTSSGKSALAKLISTCLYIEKQWYLARILPGSLNLELVLKYLSYFKIDGYYSHQTVVNFEGEGIHLIIENGNCFLEHQPFNQYRRSKIIYFPAERALVNELPVHEIRKGSVSDALLDFITEYYRALVINSNGYKPPIGPVKNVEYNKHTKQIITRGSGYQTEITAEASGVKSFLPITLVLDSIIKIVGKSIIDLTGYTIEEIEEHNQKIEEIKGNPDLNEKEKKNKIQFIKEGYKYHSFHAILEEPELNLFPDIQASLYFWLVKLLNQSYSSHLVLTTHSPYLLGFMNLSMMAYEVISSGRENLISKGLLNLMGGTPAAMNPQNISVIVFDSMDDKNYYKEMPVNKLVISDNNPLNGTLAMLNDEFEKLFDILNE